MSEQDQARLGTENSILSRTKVRQLGLEDIGVSLPDEQTDQVADSDQGEELRSAAVDAVGGIDGVHVGAAVLTADEMVYAGVPVEGDGWGVHAVELALSKAVSEGAEKIMAIAIYSETGDSGLCGRCLQAIADYRSKEVMVQLVDADGNVNGFDFDELHPTPWQS